MFDSNELRSQQRTGAKKKYYFVEWECSVMEIFVCTETGRMLLSLTLTSHETAMTESINCKGKNVNHRASVHRTFFYTKLQFVNFVFLFSISTQAPHFLSKNLIEKLEYFFS